MVARVLGHDPLEHDALEPAMPTARARYSSPSARRQMSGLVLVGRGTGVALACAIHRETGSGSSPETSADRVTAGR
jgi:hypothetical protein